jgi:hypothetical protein
MFPTLISVRNSEPPAPVTVVDTVDVVIVPVRVVLGQAVALQFPVAMDEIVADIVPDVIITNMISGRIRIFKDCKNGLLIGIGFFAQKFKRIYFQIFLRQNLHPWQRLR